MSLIEEIRKTSEGATKVRARVVAEISRIEGEISELERARAVINRSPMQKDDYLQYFLADVDARFENAASRRGSEMLQLFTTNGAERLRASVMPPTMDGSDSFIRPSSSMYVTEVLFGKVDKYGTTYDMLCFLCRDSIKQSIQAMFDSIEWPFDQDGAAGAPGNTRSSYVQDGLINLVAAKPLAVLAQESETISDKIRELTKQRDALLEEAELRGFAL